MRELMAGTKEDERQNAHGDGPLQYRPSQRDLPPRGIYGQVILRDLTPDPHTGEPSAVFEWIDVE